MPRRSLRRAACRPALLSMLSLLEALNAHGDPNCINFGGFNAPQTEGFRGFEIGTARALRP